MFYIGLKYLSEHAPLNLGKNVAKIRHFLLNFSAKKAKLKIGISKPNDAVCL